MKQSASTRNFKTIWPYALIGVLALLLVAALVWATYERSESVRLRQNQATSHTQPDTQTMLDEQGITPLDTTKASGSRTTADELAYMIEEEKLAHDAYQVLYEKWGARVFGSIQNSETSHQNLVLAVMQSRDLPDPRKSAVGEFANQELQKLYDELIAKSEKSMRDAYEVGVAIEERDIADLKDSLAQLDAKDTDVKGVFETLLRGSENHLRAFNRQVSR